MTHRFQMNGSNGLNTPIGKVLSAEALAKLIAAGTCVGSDLLKCNGEPGRTQQRHTANKRERRDAARAIGRRKSPRGRL